MIDLEEELRSLHKASFQWALHCTGGGAQDAEDALQGAYEALLDGSAKFEGRSSFKSFLFGLIRNKARSLRRKKRAGRLIALDFVDEPQVDAVGTEAMESVQIQAAIRQALRELSPKQRDVLELVFYHDLTIEEAAQVMGVGLGTARTHYKRAKNAMYQQLTAGELQWLKKTISS
jgi:RNA polymerase sigma factor (sigma-70 family)